MKIVNLGEKSSVLNQYLAEMRDRTEQQDAMRFRNNMQRVGRIFGYEISKTLRFRQQDVMTPLGIAACNIMEDQVVLASILRAGLPLHQGLLDVFDRAANAFVAVYRKSGKDYSFKVELQYATLTPLTGKILVLADPMMATGSSMCTAYDKLMEGGKPAHTHVVCPIVSKEAIKALEKQMPRNGVTLWTAAIDVELSGKSFIIPGLGNAGDLSFGEKFEL